MFGLNLRLLMPVIFVPTPPRYLALPRWVTLFPKLVFLPVKKQTRGIGILLQTRKFEPGSLTGRGTVGKFGMETGADQLILSNFAAFSLSANLRRAQFPGYFFYQRRVSLFLPGLFQRGIDRRHNLGIEAVFPTNDLVVGEPCAN